MKKSIPTPNTAKTSHFLAIDFGKAKIGLAIADEETKIAFAYDTLANDKFFLRALEEIIECENVTMIVFGMTKHEKDLQSAIEKESAAKKIANKFNVKVVFEEEMFTTKMAQENIKLKEKKNISKKDDQESARIILQSWLDKQ